MHKKNDRGETALHVAARRGDDVQCERLIEEGKPVLSLMLSLVYINNFATIIIDFLEI